MSSLHPLLNHVDFQLSQFARALALPIRVFIIRTIIENGNSISKQALNVGIFSAENINRHVQDLKSVGILKATGAKGQITYSVDQHLSEQISESFISMFQRINQIRPQIINSDNPYTQGASSVEKEESTADLLSFGQFIKKHRQELGLSQEELAKKIDIDRAQLSRIENGRKLLNNNKLNSLSKSLFLDLQTVTKAYYNHRIYKLIEESKK